MERTFKTDYAKYYDLFNRDKNYSDEIDFLELVFKKFFGVNEENKKVIKVLDLGCGTGLHTKELIKRRYSVSGLDLSKEMIEIAKKRNPSAKFYVGDMSNFDLIKNEGKFDIIICMFSALGYLTENFQLDGFFKCCKAHLKENGLLILDIWNGLGVMHELPSSREKITEVKDENKFLKITRKSFPKLDGKNHINNVRFNVKVFEEADDENNKNEGFSNDIKNIGGEIKSNESKFISRNLINTKINKISNENKLSEKYLTPLNLTDSKNNKNKEENNNYQKKNWRLIKEYDEDHKVRFFFPKELEKYMEDYGFKLLHLCPSFNLNEELSEKHWNMILVGRMI